MLSNVEQCWAMLMLFVSCCPLCKNWHTTRLEQQTGHLRSRRSSRCVICPVRHALSLDVLGCPGYSQLFSSFQALFQARQQSNSGCGLRHNCHSHFAPAGRGGTRHDSCQDSSISETRHRDPAPVSQSCLASPGWPPKWLGIYRAARGRFCFFGGAMWRLPFSSSSVPNSGSARWVNHGRNEICAPSWAVGTTVLGHHRAFSSEWLKYVETLPEIDCRWFKAAVSCEVATDSFSFQFFDIVIFYYFAVS